MVDWRKNNQVDYHHQQQQQQYQQQDVSTTPTRLHSKKPPLGSWQPTVPSWEKEFCTTVGAISWRRLLDAKKVMYYYENVVQWNDSAGEEAFHNAKNRFWAQINGLPYDTSLPDPDIYIDKIDWNSEIDPELLLDLDREPMVPDDSQSDQNTGLRGDSLIFLNRPVPSSGWGDAEEDPVRTANKSSRPGMEDGNPWECSNAGANAAAVDRTWGNDGLCTGWGDADHNQTSDAKNSSSGPCFKDCNKKADNPWECDNVGANANGEARTWGNIGEKSQAWSKWDHNNNNLFDNMRSGRTSEGGWETSEGSFRKREGTQYMSRYKTSRFQHDDYPTNSGWRNGRGRKRTNFAYERPVMDRRPFVPRPWNSFHPVGHQGSGEAW